jgi:CBS domain containing-hemolysin-like protein
MSVGGAIPGESVEPWVQAAWWAMVALGLTGTALCNGVELGAYTLNRVRLDLRANRRPPDRAAILLREEVNHPDRLLATILIFTNVFGYLASAGVTGLLTHAGYSDAATVAINFAILAPTIFVWADCVPKELFRLEADRLTFRFAGFVRVLRLVASWTGVLWVALGLARLVERVAGLRRDESHLSDARQRVAALLREGASAGALTEGQATLLDRALVFGRTVVESEMVPWSKVRPIGLEWDRARVIDAVAGLNHARFPVVGKDGRVVGALRQLDLALWPNKSLAELLSPVARLTPRMPVTEALEAMHRAGAGLGVVESDSKPVGLVTVKDLIEPLTGDLPDF